MLKSIYYGVIISVRILVNGRYVGSKMDIYQSPTL